MTELLSVHDLSVSYGAIQALKQVNLVVKEGSITAILGANGGGKTSLLKTISGLVPSQHGNIMFEGRDITKLAAEKITSSGIVHVPEGRQIFGDLTVYENLMIGAFTVKDQFVLESQVEPSLKANLSEAKRQGESVWLKKKEVIANNLTKVYRYFPVLEERKNQVAVSLSGGEQQMLAIARGLMATPKLLILDEPSLGLAPLIVKSIFEILKQLNETGLTVLIVEQNALQTLKIADYAYVIQVGTIIKQGAASALIKDPELIEAYLGK